MVGFLKTTLKVKYPNIIDTLKFNGFRWSPRLKRWQRQNTSNGIHAAKKICEIL